MWPEHLVKTKYINVCTTGLHVHQPVRGVGHCINAQAGTYRMGHICHFCHRVDGAQNIRSMGHGNPLHPGRKQTLQILQIKRQAQGVDFPDFENSARRLQACPAANIGLVIGVGHDDFIARPDVRQYRLRQLEHQ